tara:strand:- start:97300 stop:98004 length:705 start_codon:yes stop_codon:yes gene_type:complete
MCTVSYIPKNEGYIVTFNRDESEARSTEHPKKRILNNGLLITAPKDLVKGGTWIAIDDNGRTACLLNGGFTKHIPKKKYRISRGYLVINAFEAANFSDFLSNLFLEDMEPFTLLLFEPKIIQQLVWDGHTINSSKLPIESKHLWSSSTLFTPEEHSTKLNYLMEALEDNSSDSEQILKIHGKENKTPFVIDRKTVKTVSITQHYFNGKNSKLTYISKLKLNEKSTSILSTLYQS